ncbi:MAG: abortive infection family protein [Fimbriimonadales bacterium]|nr:abortive infection family protein [Fimbriimonadales bacterium]
MADITFAERRLIDDLFDMHGGYVLDFTNRTLETFIAESTGKEIYGDERYAFKGHSKANRLRAFLEVEPNALAAKLLGDLLDYVQSLHENDEEWEGLAQVHKCRAVVDRLKQSSPVIDIEAITPNATERGFQSLANAVREAIDKGEPETGLDRLHTFVVKYFRVLCKRRGIPFDQADPLHSLIGKYVKRLRAAHEIESTMTERILLSNIRIMEDFNKVRNQQSLAHDNPILTHDEALLICNHVASVIRFVESLERRRGNPPVDLPLTEWTNQPQLSYSEESPR